MNLLDLIQNNKEDAMTAVAAMLSQKAFDVLDNYSLDEALSFRGVGGRKMYSNDNGSSSDKDPGEWEPIGKYKHPETGKLTDKFRHTKTKKEGWLGDDLSSDGK